MKAVLCKSYGPPESLVVEDAPSPALEAGQVRIAVHACGVNFPDTLIIENKYQFKPPLPFSPGGEIAGVVMEVAGDVTNVKAGDKVIGMCGWGGYAEELVMPARKVLPMPEGFDFPTAAAFTLTYGTSYYALKQRANLKKGESMLVLGASGGVGLSAVEIGKAFGARVVAAASTDEKLAVCKAHGADEVINYTKEDLRARAKELGGKGGFDVIYDPVGDQFAEPALRSIGWEGRYLVIGFAAGEIPKIPLNLVLLKSCQIVGVFWGAFTERDPKENFKNLDEMAEMVRNGTLKPHISATYPLEQAAQALNDMKARKVTGKVVLVTGRS
ncbi:MAG: NADPH:quinone oxidoreductase family protein [Sneathiellaceae bacterium]